MTASASDDDLQAIRDIILREFLSGEDPRNLANDTPLITNNILDSLAVLNLITLLEQRFKIRIEPHESDVEHLNTVAQILALVNSKRSGGKA